MLKQLENAQYCYFKCLDQQSETPKYTIYKDKGAKHQILDLQQANDLHLCLTKKLKWLTISENNSFFNFLMITQSISNLWKTGFHELLAAQNENKHWPTQTQSSQNAKSVQSK